MTDRILRGLPLVASALVFTGWVSTAVAQEAQVQAPASNASAPVTNPPAPAAEQASASSAVNASAAKDAAAGAEATKLSPVNVTEEVSPKKYYGRRRVVKDGVEYYCKRDKNTGSRLSSKESCLTRQQIDNLAVASRDALDDLNRNAATQPDQSSGGQMSAMPMSPNR